MGTFFLRNCTKDASKSEPKLNIQICVFYDMFKKKISVVEHDIVEAFENGKGTTVDRKNNVNETSVATMMQLDNDVVHSFVQACSKTNVQKVQTWNSIG